jgi:hypothetical protein
MYYLRMLSDISRYFYVLFPMKGHKKSCLNDPTAKMLFLPTLHFQS